MRHQKSPTMTMVSETSAAAATQEDSASDPGELASTGLLSFYDRLRTRLTQWVTRRSGKLGKGVVEVLLLAPDVFILIARLCLDSRVPAQTRRFLFGSVAYFLTPIDLLPEGLIGPAGYLEDVILAALVLKMSLDSHIEPMAEDYWSGSQGLRVVLGDISEAAYGLLGPGLYSRLQRLLDRREHQR